MKNFLPFLISCLTSASFAQKTSYELVLDDDNIWVEKFDSTIVDKNRYNWNNKIFKVGNTFLYEFVHLTKNGDTLFFKPNENDDWDFIDKASRDKSTISTILITVVEGLGNFEKVMPNYNQTVISYIYGNEAPFSASGVIENEKNIWMHPPRDKYFQILELNPFPYIKEPFVIGNKWTWDLVIGDFWSDHRWKSWSGKVTNDYIYEIIDFKDVDTNLGVIPCYIIRSSAKSRIGETFLTSYFNITYGFVKLDYTNIDGSRTILNLSDFKTR